MSIRADKTIKRFAVLAGLGLVLFCGCAQRAEEPGVLVHPLTWNDDASVDFHGAYVRERAIDTCSVCHVIDGAGDDVVPGCAKCHDGPGGHPAGWVSPAAHGAQAALDAGFTCTECHGGDLRGGWANVSCFTCHDGPGGHPVGWVSPTAHGAQAMSDGVVSCTTCHGEDLAGGWSEVSCYTCHDGPDGD